MKNKLNYNIIMGIERVSHVFRTILREMAREMGLSPLQLQILEYVGRNMKENCNASFISEEFDIKKSTISDSIKVLEQKGMIKREKDIEDGRVLYVILTAKGRELIGGFMGYFSNIEGDLNNIPEEQKIMVLDFIIKLIKLMHKKGIIQTAKICINCSNFYENKEMGSDKPHYCAFANVYMSDGDFNLNCKYFKENNKQRRS